MPDGKSTLGCGGESFVGMTKTAAACVCEPAKADTWTCVATDSEMVMNECPAQDDPKTTGESCAGVLGPDMTQQTCMWSQKTAMDVPVESFKCTCDSTGESANVWVCDGAFAPVSASKGNDDGMMAADTAQEIIMTPVVPPTGSTGTVTVTKFVCPDAPVKTGESCADFLQGALPKATPTCRYSQFTQENNEAPVSTLTDCTCATTDLLWSCAEPVVVPSKADEETNVDDADVGSDESDLATDEASAAVTAATDAAAGTIATATDAAATVTDAAATVTDAAATVTDAAAGTIAGATTAADATIADATNSDVATDEVTADIQKKTNEADTEIADNTQEADATIAAATNESASGATTAARMAFVVVAVLATTTTIL